MLKIRIPRIPLATALRRAALAYLIVWVLSPPMAYGTHWRVLAVLAMGIWILLDLRSSRSIIWRPNLSVLAALTFVVYTFAVEALFPDNAEVSRHFPIWIMLFFLLVGESFSRGREGDARFSFWTILLVMPIWAFTTLYGIEMIAHDVARTVVRSSEEAFELSKQGVGGYALVYTALLCLPFLICISLRMRTFGFQQWPHWRRRAAIALLLGNCLLASLLILRAGYAIALVLAALVIAFIVLIRSRNPLRFALAVCFSSLLVLIGSLLVGPALTELQKVASGTEYATKVRDIRSSLQDSSAQGTVEDRSERYERSLLLFAENPILGTLTFDAVGKHSAILDRFAQYGAPIGSLFAYLMIYVPWRTLRDRRVPVGMALAFFVAAVGFPLLNNVFMSWGLVLYVFSRGTMVVMGLPLGSNSTVDNQLRGLVHA